MRRRHGRETAIACFNVAVLAVLLLGWNALSVRPLGAFDYSFWIVATLPLAFSAMTQTLPILAGGQGLAAGATAYLVSTVVAGAPIADMASALEWIGIGLALGLGIGGFSGFLIGYLRMPSTAVTMSTAVAVGAFAQLLSTSAVPASAAEPLSDLLFGPVITGIPLVPVALAAILALGGEMLRRSDWGHGLRLLGMRPGLAERMGVPAARLRASAYAIAGVGSAATGIVLAAQLGTTDLFLGAPLLLQVYAAVALGGSMPGLRGGSIVGSLAGALVVTASSNLLLPLGIDDYFSTGVDAAWLIAGILVCRIAAGHAHADFALPFSPAWRAADFVSGVRLPLVRSGVLHVVLGIFAAAAILWSSPHSDLPVVTLGLAVLALGQGAVMRAGGLDLAMPAMIALSGVAFVTLTQGDAGRVAAAIGAIALVAVALGLCHRWVARRFDRVSIVATLATGGILQVLMAWLAVKLPPGFAPPSLTLLMTGEGLPLVPALWIGWPIVLAMAVWLDRRRRRLAEAPPDLRDQGNALGAAYMLSAVCAAIFGIMLAVLSGQAHVGYGDTWLAPTLLAILLGGVPFRGGSGTLVGVIGGVLLAQSLDTLLVRFGLGSEARLVVFGLIMLAASAILSGGARTVALSR